jgi:hypothetical protein
LEGYITAVLNLALTKKPKGQKTTPKPRVCPSSSRTAFVIFARRQGLTLDVLVLILLSLTDCLCDVLLSLSSLGGGGTESKLRNKSLSRRARTSTLV